MNPVIGLDHCIIAVHDLEKARGIYEKLGFTAAPLGDHVNRATANYCLMFQDTYLELLGINQPEYPDGGLQQKLKSRGEGLHRLALGTSDADAVKAKIEALGVRTEGPTDLARPSKEPDGIVRFRNLFLEPEDLAGMPIFICGHKTPELMRNARLIDHPNGAIRFAGITGLASDPAATAQALAKLCVKYNATVILKGHETLVGNKRTSFVCKKGNAGMAVGGMGDVLSGLVSGLIAQGLSSIDAACLGVDMHASAADSFVEKHDMKSLMPSDLFNFIKMKNE